MPIPEFGGVFAVCVFEKTDYSLFVFFIENKTGGKDPAAEIL
jgi:hypothetical protein